jgi:hypothetical protein
MPGDAGSVSTTWIVTDAAAVPESSSETSHPRA